jgi:O-antigen/teichoic acid export membrane protein
MTQKNALRGTVLNLLAACARHISGVVAGLFTIPLVARSLGADGLGAWAVLSTTGYIMVLSDLGLSVAVQRAAARADEAATRRMMGLTLLVVSIVCPLLCVGAYALLLWLPDSQNEVLQADVARAAIPMLAAGLVGAVANPVRAFLIMRNVFPVLARARAYASVAQVILTAVGLAISPTLLAPTVGVLAAALLETLILVRAARKQDPHFSLRPAWPGDPAEVRDAFRQGSAALAINFGVAAAVRADALILTTYLPLSAVGAYQVAVRAIDHIAVFARQLCAWLLHRLGNPEERASAVRLGTAAIGGLVTSGVLALRLDGMALLEAGPVARDPLTALAVAVLGSAAIIYAAQEAAAATLTLSHGGAWQAARPILAGHMLNVVISLIGVRYYGAWAVAGGTACGNLLIAVLIWAGARRLLHWRASQFLWAIAPILGAIAVSGAAGWALAPLTVGRPLVSAVVCSGVTLLGTGAALLLWWRRDAASAAVVASVAVAPSAAE